MDDLISRQDAIIAVNELHGGCITDDVKSIIRYQLYGVPSAKKKWIPCSEKLPEDDKLKWLTFFQYDKRTLDVYVGFYDQEEKAWCEPTYGNRYAENIIAWMDIPKPEPYKGENAND